MRTKVDHAKLRYPYCIVWSPLPPITWILPFIGHTGIADSNGIMYDFQGSYSIGRGNLAFGSPTKYLMLDPLQCTTCDWDEGVHNGCEVYKERVHNICFDNCHSHVAQCLNAMSYMGKKNYNMLRIGIWVFFHGSFVGVSGFLKTFLPSIIFWGIVIFALSYTNTT